MVWDGHGEVESGFPAGPDIPSDRRSAGGTGSLLAWVVGTLIGVVLVGVAAILAVVYYLIWGRGSNG